VHTRCHRGRKPLLRKFALHLDFNHPGGCVRRKVAVVTVQLIQHLNICIGLLIAE
jgi:hypothetical protein